MPGTLVQVGATVMCAHGGMATIAPGSPRVLLSGMPAATMTDVYAIAGCALSGSSPPTPCVLIRWVAPATRVVINGAPAILNLSSGLCASPAQAPQGPPVVAATQTRVVGM